MEFKNKTILILSQQDWGDMFISKHHYACQLAKMGNTVYFINGPDQKQKLMPGRVKITQTAYENLFLIEHRFQFPYIIKFKAVSLFHRLIKRHINKVIKKINRHIDIVWSFDLSNTMPLMPFPADAVKIFMPVDEPAHHVAIQAAEGADIILSVTEEIIAKYKDYNVPRYFINHGVSETFINENVSERLNEPLRIALSGNFLRPDIDYPVLIEIVSSNRNVTFDFYGSIDNKKSNLASASDTVSLPYIKILSTFKNVIFHGQVSSTALAEGLKKADGFLICYDIKKDQSKGTNYHKILEYLATGKVVISNNVTTYQKYPGLIEMPDRQAGNKALLPIFSEVVKNIASYNTAAKQEERIAFAKQYTYAGQLKKIGDLLENCRKLEAA